MTEKDGVSEVRRLFSSPLPLSSVLDEIPLGIAILDTDRRVLLMNRALEVLTGFDRLEARGVHCMYVLRSSRCPRQCPLIGMGAESEAVSLEADIVNKSRKKIPVRVGMAPLADETGKLAGYIETVEDVHLLREMNVRLSQEARFGNIIGNSPRMQRVFEILPVVAQTDSSILITGETGTGKDFVAEALHNASPRSRGPFVKINCGALPETLLESELFGHQKGAFTGAHENKPGRFKIAHNGSLYLTEIGDLPLSLQVKLLTFLDDQVVYPLGATKGYQVDVRIIGATHRNLEDMVRRGTFREDLLFRLNVMRIELPPLRERGDDVFLLLDHFLREMSSRFQKRVEGFSDEAQRVLIEYSYPGNVRELRNIVEYAANLCDGDRIEKRHLPLYLLQPRSPEPSEPPETPEPSPGESPRPRELDTPPPDIREDSTWPATERKMILDALRSCGGRRGQAAARLGWGRSTLWRKMKQYGLDEQGV